MAHEVYICYSSGDKVTADAICHVLEENKFKCWIKPRDVSVNNIAKEITQAIKESKLMVLVFSEKAKNSNYVNTEVDIAFSSNIPIVVFKIDDSKLDGGLEFFLKNKHWLDAYPQPSLEFRNLVMDVSKLLDKPVKDPVISSNVLVAINNVKSEEYEPKKLSKSVLLVGTCLIPIVFDFLMVAYVDNDTLGPIFLILSGLFFIGTPIVYAVYNYLHS